MKVIKTLVPFILLAVIAIFLFVKRYEIKYYFLIKEADSSLVKAFETFRSYTNSYFYHYNTYPTSLAEFNRFLRLQGEDSISVNDNLVGDVRFHKDSSILKIYLKGPDQTDQKATQLLEVGDIGFFEFLFEDGDILIFRSFRNDKCDEPRFIFFSKERSLMHDELKDSLKKVLTGPINALYPHKSDWSEIHPKRVVFFVKGVKRQGTFDVEFFCDPYEGKFPRVEISKMISSKLNTLNVLDTIDSLYMPLALYPELLEHGR